MAFRNFNVGPAKRLRRAAYEGLPNFVVIAGPTGAGKSTLLPQLYVNRGAQAEPGTRDLPRAASSVEKIDSEWRGYVFDAVHLQIILGDGRLSGFPTIRIAGSAILTVPR